MRRPLTTEALLVEMERMNDVFGKFAAGDEILRATAAYREALGDMDLEQVQGAVGMALKLEPRFPYPAKLREHAKAWTQANRADLSALPMKRGVDGDNVVCRICGAGPRWAWLEVEDWRTREHRMVKRCLAPCDATRHPIGGWYVPMPANFVAWVDDEDDRAQPARLSGEGVI